jgi:hypothetical protein
VALIDFLIRLPFYLREYEVYKIVPLTDASSTQSPPAYIEGEQHQHHYEAPSDDEGSSYRTYGGSGSGDSARTHRSGGKSSNQALFDRQSAPRARLHAYLFFAIAALGAIGATLLLLTVIWSPCLLLAGFVYRNNRHRQRNEHMD